MELKKHHSKHSRSEQRLVVNRFTLLESVRRREEWGEEGGRKRGGEE